MYWSQPGMGLPVPATEGYSTVRHDGRDWRVYTLVQGTHALQVAQAQDERDALATKTALRTLGPFVAFIPLIGLLIWIGVGRGLRPLQTMSQAVAQAPPRRDGAARRAQPSRRAASRSPAASTRCSRASTRRSARSGASPPTPRTSCARRSPR